MIKSLKTWATLALAFLISALFSAIALDFHWEPFGWYVLAAGAGTACLLIPIGQLGPRAKKMYFPIAMICLAVFIPFIVAFATDCGYELFLIMLAISLLNACLFLTCVWVCPSCGEIVGLEKGSRYGHKCGQ
jgi:hypothetical protein